ncbi:MAG TPA: class I SAM-dependent methyltransferase [Chloroflexota bacterium]
MSADEAFDYFEFEQRFRGSPTEIRDRQSMYADLFLGRQHVVDLGCGRGELVELLRERQVGVVGVDSNAAMIRFCRSRCLPVVQADLFEYLAAQPNASLDGLSALQVIEHFAPDRILDLLAAAAVSLSSGATVVVETVNPACATALGNFFVDPTHVRPVPVQLLCYLFERAGLQVDSLRFSAPIRANKMRPVLNVDPTLVADIGGYQDYAVIGQRA